MRSIQDLTSIYDTYCSGVRCFPTKLNLVCHKESKLIILTQSENHRQKQHTLTTCIEEIVGYNISFYRCNFKKR